MLSYNYSSVRTNSVERKWATDFFFLRVVGKGLSQCFFSLVPPISALFAATVCISSAVVHRVGGRRRSSLALLPQRPPYPPNN